MTEIGSARCLTADFTSVSVSEIRTTECLAMERVPSEAFEQSTNCEAIPNSEAKDIRAAASSDGSDEAWPASKIYSGFIFPP